MATELHSVARFSPSLRKDGFFMKNQLDSNCRDEEMISDALQCEEEMTSLYNHFANKCATLTVRSELLNLLNDEHQLQVEIADEMRKRDWLPHR